MTQVVLVDSQDKPLGLMDKRQAHLGQGKLHRAISVLLFNSKKELLIQQRSSHKMLWPLFWANTCCSHPQSKESYQAAAERRLHQEFGVKTRLKFHHRFIYHAHYLDVGSEHELVHVFIGHSDTPPQPDKKEIKAWKYISLKDLKRDIDQQPQKYTPWFKAELKSLTASDIIKP